MNDLSEEIRSIVEDEFANYKYNFRFRSPIIGFADACDPLYDKLSEIIGHKQLHPQDILEGAKTVIVYFIPFSIDVIKKLRGPRVIVKEWSENYTCGNILLKKISERLESELVRKGINVKSEPPTNNYDPVELTAKWSHKSSAVIAGIGTFGLNHLLITECGTAGRLNSLIIDERIEPTKRPDGSYCLYYKSGKCKVCVEKCPTGALSVEGYDRFRCNAYLDGKNIHDLEQGCGMCSSGPCACRGFI
ncbi:MAG: epoxyqueuosine reductase [Clostridium sp.]|jgi:epoxyqueuosine reductase QueG|uniref:epoxyqueuosine reductase n=1 Tax=Clostridium sp. TaxID=1506 RepID=UPI0025C4964A|nr:epoxyqueuosine reductase [Clostridium sp.]MCH3964882.1 epoxyqueuosine reductase [Clostridium sp.]MCI1716623.1 epoxyqueuosine reductase [Clostridium sp.]MCI1800895.1 epoxyqueuosine reductase [Clostridium sp.]MCI1814800.1 epoxyqueuosine reductase [Clostridium sp.]MCI1871642.1 epoxyqueuosine reductase [Clostridium sp.]